MHRHTKSYRCPYGKISIYMFESFYKKKKEKIRGFFRLTYAYALIQKTFTRASWPDNAGISSHRRERWQDPEWTYESIRTYLVDKSNQVHSHSYHPASLGQARLVCTEIIMAINCECTRYMRMVEMFAARCKIFFHPIETVEKSGLEPIMISPIRAQ